MPEHNHPRNGGAKTMEKFFIRLGYINMLLKKDFEG
jgi:hypothetical protein